MKVVIIDGQGGRLGQMIAESIVNSKLPCDIYCIGTNATATNAMLKSGAVYGATGENPVVVAARDADVIIGPIGILSADSLLGEVTPKMALAIGQSSALKLLIPISNCNNQVIGIKKLSMSGMVEATIERLKECFS